MARPRGWWRTERRSGESSRCREREIEWSVMNERGETGEGEARWSRGMEECETVGQERRRRRRRRRKMVEREMNAFD